MNSYRYYSEEDQGLAKKKTAFSHEFIGKGEEELIDIFKRQFVRHVNVQKGYSYLTLRKENKKKK